MNKFTTENDGSLVVNGVVVVSPSTEFNREQIALAAAAPELLATLSLFVDCVDGRYDELVEIAKPLLQRARGN